MNNSIDVLIPAACLKTAGVVVAHERLAQAATHAVPPKIYAAAKLYFEQAHSECSVHLSDDVRLDDGEMVFTLHLQTADATHPIDFAALRAAIYAKLGIPGYRKHPKAQGVEATEHQDATRSGNAGVEWTPETRTETAEAVANSPPPISALPTDTVEWPLEQSGVIVVGLHDSATHIVCEAQELDSGELQLDNDPVPLQDRTNSCSIAMPGGELNLPMGPRSTNDGSSPKEATIDCRDQSARIEGTGPALHSAEGNNSEATTNELDEVDVELIGESNDYHPAPHFVLENPEVDEESEVVEVCMEVSLLTIRNVRVSHVLVLDNVVTDVDALGPDLAERLACTPHKNGGLWELREFRVVQDGATV